MIVEDSAEDAELMLRELRGAGFDLDWLRVDAEEAFTLSLDTDPDVILCDHAMPGFDALRALEILDTKRDLVPLVLVSGAIGEELAVEAMRRGAADYVLKDRLALLGPAVERALERRRVEEARRRAEHELREAEARYRALIEQIPAIVYVWGVGGRIDAPTELYVSPRVRDVLGFSPREWIASPALWIDRLHPDDRDRVTAEVARSIEAGEPFRVEYRMVAKAGHTVWLIDQATPVARDEQGRATRYQGVMLDISERKKADADRSRSLERLLAIDRERRDLMTRVISIQDEERRRIAHGLHEDTLETLFAVGIRLGTLAIEHETLQHDESYLTVARMISESITRLRHLAFELHPAMLDDAGLVTTLHDHLGALRAFPEAPRYVLVARLAREPTPAARGVVYRIAQEAIANARRHARATRVRVLVEDREGGVFVRVDDDGVGFDVGSVRGSARGRLGLTSMPERAQLAGGWWRIESAPDLGTNVEFWVPDEGES